MEKQRCILCKKIKSLKDFGKNRNSKDGYCHYCKECRSKQSRNYYIYNICQDEVRLRRTRIKNRERMRNNPNNKSKLTTKKFQNTSISNCDKSKMSKRWESWEEFYLEDNYKNLTYFELAIYLERTYLSIASKLNRMRLIKNRKW